jgi:hypothetical protein
MNWSGKGLLQIRRYCGTRMFVDDTSLYLGALVEEMWYLDIWECLLWYPPCYAHLRLVLSAFDSLCCI